MIVATRPLRGIAAGRVTGLSSGLRMLLILTIALLPLGLIALFASIQSAQSNRRQHELDAGIIARQAARQIDILLVRDAQHISVILNRAPTTPAPSCRESLSDIVEDIGVPGVRASLYSASGLRLCTTDPTMDRASPPSAGVGVDVLAVAKPEAIRVTVPGQRGYAVAEIPLAAFAIPIAGLTQSHGATLIQGSIHLRLDRGREPGPLDQRVTVTAPIAGGQMALAMTVNIATVSAVEVLLVLLPMLMWLAGAVIGWLVVERLLLRPLAELQRAVTVFRTDRTFTIPKMTTPSHEIRNLAAAFGAAAGELANHEAELEQGLVRQTKLTREVHHRVKNNLQVVASLINLHARGTSGDVARAYASIQRRVDALAVVHRNHYAEMEENRGINLRTLLSELAANLRGSAPPEAASFTITINMIPACVTQDTAVPVAFLFTEIAELVLDCDPAGGVALTLSEGPLPTRMILGLVAPGLRTDACINHPSHARFRRIIEGLARQLRAPLAYDEIVGSYTIQIPCLPDPAQ